MGTGCRSRVRDCGLRKGACDGSRFIFCFLLRAKPFPFVIDSEQWSSLCDTENKDPALEQSRGYMRTGCVSARMFDWYTTPTVDDKIYMFKADSSSSSFSLIFLPSRSSSLSARGRFVVVETASAAVAPGSATSAPDGNSTGSTARPRS